MNIKRYVTVAAISAAMVALFLACDATDVVGKVASSSFDAVVQASGNTVSWSNDDRMWVLASKAGDLIEFSTDFARNSKASGAADMDDPDVEFSFDAAPFLAAGLDPTRLSNADGLVYELEDGRLMLHFELGAESFAPDSAKSLEAVFAEIVRAQRARIGYHEKLDHYGIKLGHGNMFEWAKDLSTNDKDIVWVLDPAPFIQAGLDPSKLEGWAFAKVEMKDERGATVFVDKLLKPFDLK